MNKELLYNYRSMKHRIEQLKQRVSLDSGFEAETAKKLLDRLLEKLAQFEKANSIEPDTDSNTRSNAQNNKFTYREPDFMGDNRTEEQLMDDLGIIYAIFGQIYKKSFNYHDYTIHFIKLAENEDEAFCRVYANIYEDSMLIANNIVIAFWPFHHGDTICGDMGISSYSERGFIRYMRNGSSLLYQYLISDLKDIWNYYFGLVPHRLEANADHEMLKILTADERIQIIQQVEKQIDEKDLWTPRYLRKSMGFYTRTSYPNLKSFLEESGIIYKVKEDGVYIFYDDDKTRRYMKLIGIMKSDYGYNLELSTI